METLDQRGNVESTATLPGGGPLLFDGQRLDQPEFHERYLRMPEDFRAELIDGIVYTMNMALHPDHAGPEADVIGLLFSYRVETPGTVVHCEATTKLGARSEVQPDAVLQLDPAYGGRTRTDAKGYTVNAPELVVEVALSSLRIDLNQKKKIYEEAGALEYVVFDVSHRTFHWFALVDGRFQPLPADADGVFRSRAFPGLWIDGPAFVGGELARLMATLRLGLASAEHADFVARLAQYRANRP